MKFFFNAKPVTISKDDKLKYNIITLGYDCSPAQALRDMKLRTEALPFDWVNLSVESLEMCFKDNFLFFHKNLKFNENKTQLIDNYGFKFSHDYPTLKENNSINEDNTFNEYIIVDNWQDYHEKVLEKYKRRIERFLNIIRNPSPIIILCRHDIHNIPKIKFLLKHYYNKENVFFVVSTPQSSINRMTSMNLHAREYIKTCNTEKNGNWNETAVWSEAFQYAVNYISTK
jgi:hypothetical protein